ncbi:Mg2 transporter protein CorA family protein [Liquorilactobacillus sucicola DSM 21376 = JCM 15457]|uniref:Mg2 transporter protein CorA family protein n=2 Tax=Liquorilactobacillus sucicola TaxID=519050 RepID=A0A0R2DZG3_9LACO|nr:magnesium transporter CorA family protein [Liquorilactobacillus sucicola]KRN05604.1 Mg2 transporter protein CorA family protein [Liquorilactobacillus sucicola DSM 21376 = JCM 15457]
MIQSEKISIGPFSSWLNVDKPTSEDVQTLRKKYNLSKELLEYVTDIDEPTNYDYDKETESQLFIYHIPYKTQQGFLTVPVVILLIANQIITFNHFDDATVKKIFTDEILNGDTSNMETNILEILKHLSDMYLLPMHEIRHQRKELNDLLSSRADNKNLIALASLRKSLIYFSSATRNNQQLLESLADKHFGRNFLEDQVESLVDAKIETHQVEQLVETESEIVTQLINTFDTILSNNLNDIMKILTIWSVVLAIPTIITGFYGMNVKLPLEHNSFAWIVVIGITIAIIFWIIHALRHHRII